MFSTGKADQASNSQPLSRLGTLNNPAPSSPKNDTTATETVLESDQARLASKSRTVSKAH
jgi:hypothetical protein